MVIRMGKDTSACFFSPGFVFYLQCGKLKIDELEPNELIGIIDATMSCIVSWLEGHSLAQTVFTNLYLHQPHSILNKTLKAYCIAVYKLLDCIRECINK